MPQSQARRLPAAQGGPQQRGSGVGGRSLGSVHGPDWLPEAAGEAQLRR